MFRRSHIAEKICACRACNSAADGRCDVVIARSNICNKGAKHIKGRSMTEPFLQKYICLYLVYGHMAWALYHNLHVL